MMDHVVVATQGGEDWLDSLRDTVKTSGSFLGVNRFLCCFIDDEDNAADAMEKSLQCYPKAKQKVVNSKVQDALQCISDLIYEVALDNGEGSDSRIDSNSS